MKKPVPLRSLMLQVAIFFLLGIVTIGMITYFSQKVRSSRSVSQQTEAHAAEISQEVKLSLEEYPAYEWLLHFWVLHAKDLEIEYDVDFGENTETEKKCRMLEERHPGIQLRYLTRQQAEALPPEDQKLYAEIAYSWMITRVNQIKRSYQMNFLFCVLTDRECTTQFFLFSAADPGAQRGTDYEQVYTLGTRVEVAQSQQEAMLAAIENNTHLADAGSYVDYYALLSILDDHPVLIGLTYSVAHLHDEINSNTARGTIYAVVFQIALSVICLSLIFYFVLHPLNQVGYNIRLYRQTKDSKTVTENLEKIKAHNEIGDLAADVSDLASELDDYLHRVETITAEKERIGTELTLATRIQSAMLPSTFPAFPDRSEFDIYASMDPAREVGGDFYDFYMIDDDHLCIEMADVSGKGVPAALFMMASQILLANNANAGKSPAQILTDTNASICSNNREEMFVTVWIGILEISTGRLTAANAGHEYPVLRRAGEQFELIKDRHGFVIGGMDGIRYREYELQLNPGDKLFLYTDGLPEATDAKNRMFGNERMLAALNWSPDSSPERILANVRRSVDFFVKDAEQFDDLTMLCLEYKGKTHSEDA